MYRTIRSSESDRRRFQRRGARGGESSTLYGPLRRCAGATGTLGSLPGPRTAGRGNGDAVDCNGDAVDCCRFPPRAQLPSLSPFAGGPSPVADGFSSTLYSGRVIGSDRFSRVFCSTRRVRPPVERDARPPAGSNPPKIRSTAACGRFSISLESVAAFVHRFA
ncbi:hypothetical protein EA472_08270 [Natrarchaeobius oligotrophus]|uniref:Uncharacterized protein n=1 Tax=Natrarchaeobius chitinivorans TaxID=1679083 RepID=A0A3N6N1J9_NATCH|nr:hypothetical protein EA472_08270 [Natrarchaeobius chitinivorans]